MQSVHDFRWELLPAGHIYTLCFFIVKGICEQQDMEISLNIAVHAAVREVNIAVGFQIYAQYSFFQVITTCELLCKREDLPPLSQLRKPISSSPSKSSSSPSISAKSDAAVGLPARRSPWRTSWMFWSPAAMPLLPDAAKP